MENKDEPRVSYFVIGDGILELYKDLDIRDLGKIIKKVQLKIMDDPVMRLDHTIMSDNPKLIVMIKTAYDERMTEKPQEIERTKELEQMKRTKELEQMKRTKELEKMMERSNKTIKYIEHGIITPSKSKVEQQWNNSRKKGGKRSKRTRRSRRRRGTRRD